VTHATTTRVDAPSCGVLESRAVGYGPTRPSANDPLSVRRLPNRCMRPPEPPARAETDVGPGEGSDDSAGPQEEQEPHEPTDPHPDTPDDFDDDDPARESEEAVVGDADDDD
jgi:hypothetical protein